MNDLLAHPVNVKLWQERLKSFRQLDSYTEGDLVVTKYIDTKSQNKFLMIFSSSSGWTRLELGLQLNSSENMVVACWSLRDNERKTIEISYVVSDDNSTGVAIPLDEKIEELDSMLKTFKEQNFIQTYKIDRT